MKKILVIAPQNPYPPNDGGKIGIYYPVIHLSKYFKVHFAFITSTEVPSTVYDHFKSFNVTIHPQKVNTKDSIPGYLLNIISTLPYKFQKYCSHTILQSLQKVCEKEGIEHVWCNHSHVAWYGLQLKKNIGANIFLREHNIEYSLVYQVMEVQKNIFIKGFIWYQYLKTKKYEQKCWKNFQKIFFISDLDYAIAKPHNKHNNFLIVYDSFQADDELIKVTKEPFSFIFTASIDSFQNEFNLQKFLSLVWQPLIAKDNRWRLYITGNMPGVLKKKLKINLEENNIEDLGFVTDVQATIASKKYFLSPTYIGSGLRIKVLNALSKGCVCFATPLDVQMLHVLKDEHNIIEYCDFNDFYSKLLRLEADATLYNEISMQAVLVGKTFSWHKYVDIVYNEVVKVESFTGR